VRHEDGGDFLHLVELAQPAAQVAADHGVERAERLVEQQDSRLAGEGAGQCDTLALAAGELGGVAAGERFKLDEA